MEKQELRNDLESGKSLRAPDGILFNGLGPYQYDKSLVPDGIPYQIINVEPGTFLVVKAAKCNAFSVSNMIDLFWYLNLLLSLDWGIGFHLKILAPHSIIEFA